MTQQADRLVLQEVRKSAARYVRRNLIQAFLASWLLVGAAFLIYLIFWHAVGPYSTVPAARWLFSILLVVLPVCAIVVPILMPPSLSLHASRLEGLNPPLKNRLLAAVQLTKARDTKERYSTALIDGVIERTHELLAGLRLREPVNRHRFDLLLRASLLMVAGLLLLGALAPEWISFPLFSLTGAVPYPKRTVLTVAPGDTTVVKGASVRVFVTPYGRMPGEVQITYKVGDGEWVSEVSSTDDGCQMDFSRIIHEIRYKAEADGASTREYTIAVTRPPELTHLSCEYVYPSYTGLPRMKSTKSDGNVVALAGTRVHLKGTASQVLSEALFLVEGDTVVGEVSADSLSAVLLVEKDCRYTIELTDVHGNKNVDPPFFSITGIPDEYPSVRIVEPASDIDAPKDMIVGLSYRATDDFGVARIELVSTLEGTVSRIPMERTGGDEDSLHSFDWDLTELGLLPGQSVSYYLEVYDNDSHSGPKSARSETYTVTFPTLQEIYDRIAEEEERSMDEIMAVMPRQEEMLKRLDEISTKLKATKEMAWENRETVEEVMEKQQEIVQEMEELSQQVESAVDQMREGMMVDDEILSKMAEVARLMQEVMTDEMREALEKLRDAMESLEPEEIEKALSELKLSQEELHESLDRTLEILKRLQQERELAQLADKAAQLRDQEEALKQRTQSAADDEELRALAEEQEKIREQLEQLKRELDELSRELPEVSDMLQEGVQKSQEAGSKMKQASQALSSAQRQESLSHEDRALESLASLSEGLSFACSSLSSARRREMMEAMRGAVADVVYLSTLQESLIREIREATQRPDVDTRDLAVTESALDRAIEKLAEKIYKISQKTLFISPVTGRSLAMARSKMNEAEELLERGMASRAVKSARGAMQDLNEAAASLMQALSSCQSSQCSSGAQECLQNMASLASRQGALNEACKGMCPTDLETAGMSMQARSQLARLAAEQRAIKEGVEATAQTYSEEAELAGRVDDLVGEMEEIARSIERRQLDRSIIERQERILSRLLDAQRSVRRRDYTQRRQAESGENVSDRQSPPEAPSETRSQLTREDLLRALKEGYPPEYESLIKAYFKALSESSPE